MRLLAATRKGLFRLERLRGGWRIDEPLFLGANVVYAARDDQERSWASLRHGHWGPKLHAADGDGPFREVGCPKLPDGPEAVREVCLLARSGETLWAGTVPGALFASRDGGRSWERNEALWERRRSDGWFPSGGGVMLHSIAPDPRSPARLAVGVSCGGVYATDDGGATWEPRNEGVPADYLPDRFPPVGQDPHRLLRHPLDPDLLWQQNHCGNFRSPDGGRSWSDVTGDAPPQLGFALALDDERPAGAWTVPHESDARRVARDGALTAFRTEDGGASWRPLRGGLPQTHCYDIVYRHGLAAAGGRVAFGTNAGRIFASRDRGEHWETAAGHLPPVQSLQIVRA